eukprot:3108864-Pleurochrysis_carterae.AAC.3
MARRKRNSDLRRGFQSARAQGHPRSKRGAFVEREAQSKTACGETINIRNCVECVPARARTRELVWPARCFG